MEGTKYTFDYETSKAVYERNKGVITPQMCYNNVFQVIVNEFWKNRKNNWKVAYGYFSLDDENKLYARHCFILDGTTVIDPTVIAYNEGKEKARDYLVFKVFDTYEEYINALENEEGHYPALEHTLFVQNMEFCKAGTKKGLLFI